MTKKDNTPEQKIPWYRRRWFWGAVILAVIIIAAVFYYVAPQNNFHSIIDLVGSIFWAAPLGIVVIILALSGVDSSLWPVVLYSFRVLYLLLFALLLYKTFYNSRVKIIYPALLVVIFIIGILFGVLASSFT